MATYVARWHVSSDGKRGVNARVSRKAKRICTPGLGDPQLLEQLVEVAVGALERRLVALRAGDAVRTMGVRSNRLRSAYITAPWRSSETGGGAAISRRPHSRDGSACTRAVPDALRPDLLELHHVPGLRGVPDLSLPGVDADVVDAPARVEEDQVSALAVRGGDMVGLVVLRGGRTRQLLARLLERVEREARSSRSAVRPRGARTCTGSPSWRPRPGVPSSRVWRASASDATPGTTRLPPDGGEVRAEAVPALRRAATGHD